MASIGQKIEITDFTYRPCLVGDKKALFHKWFDNEIVYLKSNFHMKPEDRDRIYNEYWVGHILPMGVEPNKIKMLRGLVEYENGKMDSVTPDQIQFLDTGNQMFEYGVSFDDRWIEHVKGEDK